MQREEKCIAVILYLPLHFPLVHLLIHTAQDTKASENSVLMYPAVSLD